MLYWMVGIPFLRNAAGSKATHQNATHQNATHQPASTVGFRSFPLPKRSSP